MRPILIARRCLSFLLLALMATVPRSAMALTASQVYERVKDSVVVVMATDRTGKAVGLGSGVMLPTGDVVTNHHVVKVGAKYTVGQRGKMMPAFLQGSNPDKDLALLLAPGLTATPARLGQASRLKVGEKVFAVGSPQGLELSLSEGIVSQLRGGPPPIIQTTVAISQGSSGGGLFNADGELVGITTFYLKEGQGLNFAVPVEWVGDLVASSKPGQFEKAFNLDRYGPPRPEAGEKSSNEWSDQAFALFEAEDWHGLIKHCRRWTQVAPNNEKAWFGLGTAYSMLHRWQNAAVALREHVRLKPDDAKAWYCLGLPYGELGRHREAIEAYREALRLKPDYVDAWHKLGFAYWELGRYQEAIEALRESLRLKPSDANAWYNLGNAYRKLVRFQEAIEAYREALRLKPDFADAWNNLALAYGISGNRGAALQAVKELRRYNPQKADKVFNLIMKP